jgi:hypothetical protein
MTALISSADLRYWISLYYYFFYDSKNSLILFKCAQEFYGEAKDSIIFDNSMGFSKKGKCPASSILYILADRFLAKTSAWSGSINLSFPPRIILTGIPIPENKPSLG